MVLLSYVCANVVLCLRKELRISKTTKITCTWSWICKVGGINRLWHGEQCAVMTTVMSLVYQQIYYTLNVSLDQSVVTTTSSRCYYSYVSILCQGWCVLTPLVQFIHSRLLVEIIKLFHLLNQTDVVCRFKWDSNVSERQAWMLTKKLLLPAETPVSSSKVVPVDPDASVCLRLSVYAN